MTECPNCTESTEDWDDHFGAQGWLCEPAPTVARVTTLVKSILRASQDAGV